VAAQRIAVFVHGCEGGGAQRLAVRLSGAFAERGRDVDLVVARPRGPLRGELSERVRLVTLGRQVLGAAAGRSLRPVRVGVSAPALAAYLRSERPDALLSAANHVHLAALVAHALSGGRARLVLRVSNHLTPQPGAPRGLFALARRQATRRLFPRAHACIAVSCGVAEDLVRFAHVPESRIETIYNPIDTAELARRAAEPADHPWLAPGEPPLVLAAGRLHAQKDFATLIRAFALLRARRPARLAILGEGALAEPLREKAREAGVADDVLLPGYVANPMSWMARAAVFALSSAWEGLPGVLIEALACGCTCVSTDCPSGPAEILAGGEFGILVPVGDAAALCDALERALDAPLPPERLRARAAAFSFEGAIDAYLRVLDAGARP
jgi:glycosyltransferase involved in cell wall biosynthesis